ncbi:sucrose transporter [Klebsormidium nitens]|uniref:Sucrose transporter n=1 Tax=Klebsormidium nitens TaxID=105231 RepID=A0A1Y1HRE7_KLENI|nr:sucrose transporter [Klebsormidium nitens]|eukprot:GAQ80673.1 sucrose transporter [Klebsormidium nitens]
MSEKQRQQSRDEAGIQLSSLIPSTTSPSNDEPHTTHRKHVREENGDNHAASSRGDKSNLERSNSHRHRSQPAENGYKHVNGHKHAPGEDLEEFEIVEEAVGSQSEENGSRARISNVTLALASMVASGVQFGWALQLSLLTPYVQELGIPHAWASFIWLCGPISGLVVQPCIGIWSDNCTHKWGRRRPFILGGAVLVAIAVLVIGFSADMGYLLGDKLVDDGRPRYGACTVFIIGFWILDLANNAVQGPVRALVADLSSAEQRNIGNAFFSMWMAMGNVLGYSTGATGQWHLWFPFLNTAACGTPCANLKAAFLIAVFFLAFCTLVTLLTAQEKQFIPSVDKPEGVSLLELPRKPSRDLSHSPVRSPRHRKPAQYTIVDDDTLEDSDTDREQARDSRANGGMDLGVRSAGTHGSGKNGLRAVVDDLQAGLRELPTSMRSVMVVMALTWLAWFPFLLFDTDWMGREVYQGSPQGNKALANLYQLGVREGALGLLLQSVVSGLASLFIDPLCRWLGSSRVWALGNVLLFFFMAATAVVTRAATTLIPVSGGEGYEHPSWVRGAAVTIFACLGAPLAVTFSVPFSLTAEVTAGSGGGQGLAVGILNLAIVLPQVVVSLGSGPWDALFGGGNEPAFVAGALFALAGAVVAILRLPRTRSQDRPPDFVAHGFP